MDAQELEIKKREHKLEIWKVYVSVLTPIVLVVLTYVVNNAIQERGALLKREEQILSEKQKIYAELGRRLNIFYIYVSDIGDFSSYTPPRVIEMKREADRQFFMYLPYWSEKTEKLYTEYMMAAFQTYNGAGLPAKIKSYKDQKVAAYGVSKLSWDASWDSYFLEKVDNDISSKYYSLVESFLADTVSAGIRSNTR
jgi:hypothetical protein